MPRGGRFSTLISVAHSDAPPWQAWGVRDVRLGRREVWPDATGRGLLAESVGLVVADQRQQPWHGNQHSPADIDRREFAALRRLVRGGSTDAQEPASFGDRDRGASDQIR